jgi:hypothetical protein
VARHSSVCARSGEDLTETPHTLCRGYFISHCPRSSRKRSEGNPLAETVGSNSDCQTCPCTTRSVRHHHHLSPERKSGFPRRLHALIVDARRSAAEVDSHVSNARRPTGPRRASTRRRVAGRWPREGQSRSRDVCLL